jgi:hypothetical protein
MDPADPFDEANPSMHYDGGWERMVDDGHELADLKLGPVHPYDRDGYTPSHRWGSRHTLTVRSYNDPMTAAEVGDSEALRLVARAAPRNRDVAGGPRPKRLAAAAQQRGATKSSKQSRDARRRAVANILGVSLAELKRIRIAVSAAQGGARSIPKAERPQAIAQRLGWTLDELRQYQDIEATSAPTGQAKPSKTPGGRVTVGRSDTAVLARPTLSPKTGGTAPLTSRPSSVAKPALWDRRQWSDFCGDCGGRKDIYGQCRCNDIDR